MSHASPGTVYLVGAGPGDPELITVKGLRLVQTAQAIVYDALVNPALLKQASAKAILIDGGKRAGYETMSQAEINQTLLELAQRHQTVVRLKGGDPFVFGRGGEELHFLQQAGIPVEVVPGVTSAIAVPGAVGVPLTHRNVARNFTVVTGHQCKSGPGPNWQALAQIDTLVILMGRRNLQNISRELISAGKSPATPALAVEWGTMPQQKIVRGTLESLFDEVTAANLHTPSIIVVGDVVGLAK